MADKHIITDGCDFQSGCIEYKDISYLKIMPICAIHELSIACHDKVNKCKYYKLYKQLKHKEQECEELKTKKEIIDKLRAKEQECNNLKEELRCNRRSIKDLSIESSEICKILEKYKQALDEIEEYLDAQQKYFDGEDYHNLLDIINKTKGETDEES